MARTAEPSDLATPASCTGQGDQIGTTGGATTWGPADTTALTTARPASAESEVRPGPRPPTLRAHRAEARQAEPEALATASLPNRASGLHGAALAGTWFMRARLAGGSMSVHVVRQDCAT